MQFSPQQSAAIDRYEVALAKLPNGRAASGVIRLPAAIGTRAAGRAALKALRPIVAAKVEQLRRDSDG